MKTVYQLVQFQQVFNKRDIYSKVTVGLFMFTLSASLCVCELLQSGK